MFLAVRAGQGQFHAIEGRFLDLAFDACLQFAGGLLGKKLAGGFPGQLLSGADVEGIRAASAREREARQNLYDYMDTLRLDMESTWSNYLAAKEQYKFYTKAVENNTYTRQAYHDQFLLGTRSLLDVLDSENELYNSASQAETARGNILVGAYRMCALAGDLLPRMGAPAEEIKSGPKEARPVQGEEFELGWFK